MLPANRLNKQQSWQPVFVQWLQLIILVTVGAATVDVKATFNNLFWFLCLTSKSILLLLTSLCWARTAKHKVSLFLFAYRILITSQGVNSYTGWDVSRYTDSLSLHLCAPLRRSRQWRALYQYKHIQTWPFHMIKMIIADRTGKPPALVMNCRYRRALCSTRLKQKQKDQWHCLFFLPAEKVSIDGFGYAAFLETRSSSDLAFLSFSFPLLFLTQKLEASL